MLSGYNLQLAHVRLVVKIDLMQSLSPFKVPLGKRSIHSMLIIF